jgi:hypothetical protein
MQPAPATAAAIDAPSALIARLDTVAIGTEVEITPELYDYFLNVLPPRGFTAGGFLFAEGADRIRAFRLSAGRAFCQNTDRFARG